MVSSGRQPVAAALLVSSSNDPITLSWASTLPLSRSSGLRIDTGKGRIRLTCSLGVGEGKAGDTVDQILARADAALYDAKLKGRNCVVGINARVPMRNAVVTEGIVRALAM